MSMRPDLGALLLLIAAPVLGSETLLYEDFQDGDADGWQAFGKSALRVTEYQGNGSLRMTKDAVAARAVPVRNLQRARVGASFAASGLDGDEACIGEATFDDGQTWFEIVRVVDGQDDSLTLHAGAVSRDVPPGTARVWFRARVTGNQSDDICWLDDVYMLGDGAAMSAKRPYYERTLSRSFLLGDKELAEPVSMLEFTPHGDRAAANNAFSGALRLIDVHGSDGFEAIQDDWDRVAEIGKAIRHLPEFDFEFIQRGDDVVPLRRGVQRREHPYWEVILQPGRAWNEAGDGDWTRIAVPFSLQERSANCTHNGALMWLFNADGEVSRAAYQISSETCGYLKLNLWGVVDAEYELRDLTKKATPHIDRLDSHRDSRLPVRPLAQLAEDFPGVEPLSFGVEDGIHPDDMTVFGMVVDGIHYRSECPTRHGSYPFCDSVPMPSYSTAKSIFAGIATMRAEKLIPKSSQQTIASLIDECDKKKWRDVSVENALDMATGNYRSTAPEEDEYSIPHWRFVFWDDHARKLEFACDYFKRKAEPGTQFVYHTSDTYLVGAALRSLVELRWGESEDLYRSVLVEPIWRALNLSPLLDETKRTYDAMAHPLTGWGLTVEADDIVRIAAWLNNEDARLNGEPMLDAGMLDASLQRIEADRGLATEIPNLNYNNGFWAFNAGPSLGCGKEIWVPFMSGVSGITVAMFPNGVIYYYFSDGHVFRWQSARVAANTIRSMCP